MKSAAADLTQLADEALENAIRQPAAVAEQPEGTVQP